MKKLLTLVFGAALFVVDKPATAEEKPHADSATYEILLKDIWGNVSSDCQPLRKLEPAYFIYRDTPENIKRYESLTSEQLAEISRKAEDSYNIRIERAMRSLDASKENGRSGFAVVGHGREALKGVFEVLVKGEKPANHFKKDTNISIVFFSYPAQPLVSMNRVDVSQSTIDIRYSLISHGALSITSALAIIPLSNMVDGKYHVKMIREPSSKRDETGFPPATAKLENQVICEDFEFVVGSDK